MARSTYGALTPLKQCLPDRESIMTSRYLQRTRHPHPASHLAFIDRRYCCGKLNCLAKLELMDGRASRRLAMLRKPVLYRTRPASQRMISISDRYGELTGLRRFPIPF